MKTLIKIIFIIILLVVAYFLFVNPRPKSFDYKPEPTKEESLSKYNTYPQPCYNEDGVTIECKG